MKPITILTVLIAAAGMFTAPVQAIETDMITVGDQVVMRIRAGSDGRSPADRADAIRRRLAFVLSRSDAESASITVRQELPNRGAAIYVGDHLLMEVDRTLAEANGMGDPLDLARLWAVNLRKALLQAPAEGKVGGF